MATNLENTKIMIGVPTMEHIRRAEFLTHLMGLAKPNNSLFLTVHGQSPAAGRNFIIRQALEQNCTHIFFMDDDVVMPNDTILKLLNHDKDIVTGLYLMRSFPHFPVLFDEAFEDGTCKFMSLTGDKTGFMEVKNCGFGVVLIKIEVFRKMLEEDLAPDGKFVTLGEIEKDGWCDDISFFNRARKAGFKIYADLDIVCGHMVSTTAWPFYADGAWQTQYRSMQGNVAFPQHTPSDSNELRLMNKNLERELLVTK